MTGGTPRNNRHNGKEPASSVSSASYLPNVASADYLGHLTFVGSISGTWGTRSWAADGRRGFKNRRTARLFRLGCAACALAGRTLYRRFVPVGGRK